MRSGPFCLCCGQTNEPLSQMTADSLIAYQSLLKLPNQPIASSARICVECSGLLDECSKFSQEQSVKIDVCIICRQPGEQLLNRLKLEDIHDQKQRELFNENFGFLSDPEIKVCLNCMVRFERVNRFFQNCFQSQHQLSPSVPIQDVKHEQEEIIEDVVLDDEASTNEERPVKSQEPQTRYYCEKCSEAFKYRNFFLEHMAKHKGEWKIHQCRFCEETFTNQLDLDKHSSLHQLDNIKRGGGEEYPCPECGLVFMVSLDVELHLYHVHDQMIGHHKTEFTALAYPNEVEERLKQIRMLEGATHRYECLQCGAKLRERNALKQHLSMVHSKARPFICPQCPCSYKSKASLKHHMQKHKNEFTNVITHEVFGSAEKAFACRYCTKSYSSERTRQQHEVHVHINRRYFLCKFCDKQFIHKRSVWEHAFTHRDFFPYNCLECDYEANQRQNFSKHLRKVHNQQFNSAVHEYTKETFDQVVDFCLLSRERLEDINSGEQLAKNPTDFRCNKCVKVFATNQELQRHQSSHERHFQCHHCSTIYYHRRFIEAHLAKRRCNKKHPQPQKRKQKRAHKYAKSEPIEVKDPQNKVAPFLVFPCPSCSKQFRSKISANRHISQTHGALGRKFECLVCAKFYPSPKSLKRHLETVHTSVKEFQCPGCASTYKTQQSLSIHMRLHDTANDCFSCQQCVKTFKSEAGLVKHVKISHRKELEMCQVCYKTFVTVDGLFEHSFVHKGFDPFLCPKSDCPYTVKGKECFASHLLVHHGIVYDEKVYGYKATEEDRHREAFLQKVKLLELQRKYQCHHCDNKRFDTKTKLMHHMTHKHMAKSKN